MANCRSGPLLHKVEPVSHPNSYVREIRATRLSLLTALAEFESPRIAACDLRYCAQMTGKPKTGDHSCVPTIRHQPVLVPTSWDLNMEISVPITSIENDKHQPGHHKYHPACFRAQHASGEPWRPCPASFKKVADGILGRNGRHIPSSDLHVDGCSPGRGWHRTSPQSERSGSSGQRSRASAAATLVSHLRNPVASI